ncbi:DNA cytosine methyltransferase [Streptomyces sp. HNM0574]|uniref:DNA cytosine methyltransferase n=1 Tax=Streptomyces sp. HNM0574 TaxID=2714954 RepID=UPI00146D040B|nr:DNA cytosine methyltransferase [Streptomyces sp. HNM0574]NLU68430.1 DNA cytosine methyltransferase [Streptomyces sp. HNM0574]
MTDAPPHQPRPADFRIVDLFAGPGGLDVAAAALGIPSIGIELDPNACETRKAADLKTVNEDVSKQRPIDFHDANVLAGGPPCQTFSVAGMGAGRRALDEVLKFVQRLVDRDDRDRIDADLALLDDARTGLVLEPLRWALEAIDNEQLSRYESIVLEQVPAVLPVWEAFADVLEAEGYSTHCNVLHAEEYGVPQTRRRAVLIARAKGPNRSNVALPPATHHRYQKGKERPRSDATRATWVAMEDELTERRAPFKVVSNYGTGGDPKARGRRRSCEPSATVTGKNSRNRLVTDDAAERDLGRFSSREAGRLQTFPANYPWEGRDIAQQIGNAVPPRLGVHVLCAALGLGVPTEPVWERLRTWPVPSDQLPDSAFLSEGTLFDASSQQ